MLLWKVYIEFIRVLRMGAPGNHLSVQLSPPTAVSRTQRTAAGNNSRSLFFSSLIPNTSSSTNDFLKYTLVTDHLHSAYSLEYRSITAVHAECDSMSQDKCFMVGGSLLLGLLVGYGLASIFSNTSSSEGRG
jgi:hypothetical protein